VLRTDDLPGGADLPQVIATGIKYPTPPDDPADEAAQAKYEKQKATYEKKLQKAIDTAVQTKEIPDGVLGLAPDGDRQVDWRWMGPVYEDTAQDKLNQSIFTRNLQELGVDSIEALKYLFPSKTDDEIAGMLSGFPFRMVGEVQRAYSAFIDLVNQEMRTPHPQQPNLPMAADPRLDLTPFLYRTLESLQKEVTYAGRYRNADPIGTPSIPDPAEQLRGSGSDGGAGSSGFNNVPMGGALPTSGGPSPANAGPDGGERLPVSPYKEAFNKVVGLLSSPVQFPSLGQQSTQTPAEAVQANYGSQQATQFNSLGMQTSMPGTNSNPAYSNSSSQASLEISPDQLRANGVSEASLEIIDHFGPDVPKVLNDYSCQLEDALIQTNQQLIEAVNLLQELSAEHKAYETILTDPDVLADYTCEFFGENGPYPVPEEQAAPAPQMQAVGTQLQRPVAPQRPEMPAPPQPQVQQGNPAEFWNSFGNLADRDPGNAWRYLNQAQANPEVFRQKMLVME
jgi:hypothetical protein